MLIVGNVIQLHFPRLLFQSILFMGLVGSIFQETTLGVFPPPVLSSTPPSLFPIILWHLLKQTHVQNTSLVLQTFVPSLSEIVCFCLVGGHVDEWARPALSAPPSVGGLELRGTERLSEGG